MKIERLIAELKEIAETEKTSGHVWIELPNGDFFKATSVYVDGERDIVIASKKVKI